ncbi:type II CAAX prenyl endopeptidase Rce1 family protein [Ruania zhangjianzhongii]|uniref:CPBP family glutamic-type intramembrane protease n=1 Tax=Ruania zhangjianzhongii TaxID=2603206 RepID=UPI00143DA392|nr:CPBP family glutamic-type intramembrane protease [Ruania zhangjianzhongii]
MSRTAAWFVIGTLGLITAICGIFWLLDAEIPEWFTVVGRWLPALVSLVVLRLTALPGGLLVWWRLRPGGIRRLLAGAVTGVAVLLVVYALSAAVLTALTSAEFQPWSVLGPAAVMLIPSILIFSLSTLGEEVGWRGFLQQALPWGFWPSAVVVAAVWVAFHLPLHGVMAAQGTISPTIAVASTLGLFPLGLLLSALVHRFGSVWPAVLGHALPLSALNLVADAGDLTGADHALLATVTGLLLVLAAWWIVRTGPLRPASPADHIAGEAADAR